MILLLQHNFVPLYPVSIPVLVFWILFLFISQTGSDLESNPVSITPIKEADVVRHLEGRLIQLLLSKQHHQLQTQRHS